MSDTFLTQGVTDWVENSDLEKTRMEAGKRIQQDQVKRKAYCDNQWKKCHNYNIGDLVVFRRANLTSDGNSKKLLPKFNGPYILKEVLDHDKYIVQDGTLIRCTMILAQLREWDHFRLVTIVVAIRLLMKISPTRPITKTTTWCKKLPTWPIRNKWRRQSLGWCATPSRF